MTPWWTSIARPSRTGRARLPSCEKEARLRPVVDSPFRHIRKLGVFLQQFGDRRIRRHATAAAIRSAEYLFEVRGGVAPADGDGLVIEQHRQPLVVGNPPTPGEARNLRFNVSTLPPRRVRQSAVNGPEVCAGWKAGGRLKSLPTCILKCRMQAQGSVATEEVRFGLVLYGGVSRYLHERHLPGVLQGGERIGCFR